MELLLQLQPNYIKKKKLFTSVKNVTVIILKYSGYNANQKLRINVTCFYFFIFFLRDFNEQYAEGLYAEGPKNSVIDNWTVKVLILMQSEKKINKP